MLNNSSFGNTRLTNSLILSAFSSLTCQLLSTASVDPEEEKLFAQELSLLQEIHGQAESLWVEEFRSALSATCYYLHARPKQRLRPFTPAHQTTFEQQPGTPDKLHHPNIKILLEFSATLARLTHLSLLEKGSADRAQVNEDTLVLEARQLQAKSCQAMSKKYNKKWTVDQFKKGKIVALKIPWKLQILIDNLRMFCIVLDRLYKNTYELMCQHRILDQQVPTKNLERVPETVAQGINILAMTITISLA